ncbi:MAG: hypothetical protein ACK55I_13000, partial [bacterium]
MDTEAGAVASTGPVAAADEDHRQGARDRHDPQEEGDAREADEASAADGEVLRQAPGPHSLRQLRIHHRRGLVGDGQGRVEDQA